jgi:hypothetical protein
LDHVGHNTFVLRSTHAGHYCFFQGAGRHFGSKVIDALVSCRKKSSRFGRVPREVARRVDQTVADCRVTFVVRSTHAGLYCFFQGARCHFGSKVVDNLVPSRLDSNVYTTTNRYSALSLCSVCANASFNTTINRKRRNYRSVLVAGYAIC